MSSPKREASPSAKQHGEVSTAIEHTPHGVVMHRSSRCYEVKGMAAQGTQLRVTVKAFKADASDKRFELSTIDLYSARSREWFASMVAKLFGVGEDVVVADLAALIEQAEAHNRAEAAEPAPRIEMTDAERDEALSMLKSPKLFDLVLADYEALGFTGENTNKLLGYLVALSRKLEEPLSLLVQSRSGAGKSALADAILALVPEEDAFKYSRITDQALFYKAQDSLVHKLLAIEETAGMGGAAYSIRAMQSAKKLRIATTGKDPVSGRMQTGEYEVRGPVSVLLTSTATDFDQETLSRFVCVTVDESMEMTRKIHETQRQWDTIEGIVRRRAADRTRRKHQNAQRLIEPVVVANPYAPQLTFPSVRLSARRDHVKYLGLMKSLALLYQHQRERKRLVHAGEEISYVEVTLADIAKVNAIAAEVLGESSQDITPQGRQLLGLIRKMLTNGHAEKVGKDGVGVVTRRLVREYTGWSDWQLRTHLAELVELEFVHVRAGRLGKEYLYELGEGADGLSAHPAFGLTDVEELKAVLAKAPVQAALWPRLSNKERGRGVEATP